LLAGIVYTLLYLAFYPTIYTTMDEASYFGNAYVLRQGTIYSDVADVFVATNYPQGGHLISKYPLGMAGVIALLSLISWKLALGVNLLIHLLTFTIIVRILRRMAVPSAYALLYLLHPTAVIYSRTVMADPFSGLLMALAFDGLLARREALVGFWTGASLMVRTGNILALPSFVLSLWVEEIQRNRGKGVAWWKALLSPTIAFMSALPFVLFAGFYQVIVAGGLSSWVTGSFQLAYFPEMFTGYVGMLMLLYPGMLLAPLLYRGEGKIAAVGICYGTLLLYSFWFYRDTGSNPIETLIVGQRYFLAVMPLFIVTYAQVVYSLWKRIPENLVVRRYVPMAVSGVVLLVFCGIALIHVRHSRFLGKMAVVRDAVIQATTENDRIVCNTQIAKLLHPAWGVRTISVPWITTEAQEKLQNELQEWSAKEPGRRIVFALWVREGRKDDQEEADRVRRVANRFPTMKPTEALPEQVHMEWTGSGTENLRTPEQ
jgi:hypothetical protein